MHDGCVHVHARACAFVRMCGARVSAVWERFMHARAHVYESECEYENKSECICVCICACVSVCYVRVCVCVHYETFA